MEHHSLFFRFGVALFIGLLVGLQREYSYDLDGGPERTRALLACAHLPLLGLLGCTAAFLPSCFQIRGCLSATTFFVIGGLITACLFCHRFCRPAGYDYRGCGRGNQPWLARYVIWDQLAIAVAIAVVMATLLSFKFELHGFAERLTREDIVAALEIRAARGYRFTNPSRPILLASPL